MAATLTPPQTVPWWRVGVMWLFVGGLGAVVVGSLALVATAVNGADPLSPQEIVQASKPGPSTAPALIGRNHAASPMPARPAP